MPLAFSNETVVLEAGTGRRDIRQTASFDSRVISADAAVKGFSLDYVPRGEDHHINIVAVDVDLLSIRGNDVEFLVQVLYADKNFDDSYQGFVNVLIIAEVE